MTLRGPASLREVGQPQHVSLESFAATPCLSPVSARSCVLPQNGFQSCGVIVRFLRYLFEIENDALQTFLGFRCPFTLFDVGEFRESFINAGERGGESTTYAGEII